MSWGLATSELGLDMHPPCISLTPSCSTVVVHHHTRWERIHEGRSVVRMAWLIVIFSCMGTTYTSGVLRNVRPPLPQKIYNKSAYPHWATLPESTRMVFVLLAGSLFQSGTHLPVADNKSHVRGASRRPAAGDNGRPIWHFNIMGICSKTN